MIARHLTRKLKSAAGQYPVVTLTGPRQSGKTTLVRAIFKDYDYASLENPDQREFALQDPRGFLAQFKSCVILDEVQRVPELFSYIQGIVDEVNRPGQFILSGSQNFLLLEKISQSLAGRACILHLLPFSRSELAGRSPMRLKDIGTKVLQMSDEKKHWCEVLFTGFYPRIHDQNLEPGVYYRNYYQTYVERDVRNIANVGNIEAFGRFIRLCAGRTGQLLNVSSLGSDCGITHSTARRWLSVLEASFIITLLKPHHRSWNKRLVKSPKLYFLDAGLLCYLLRIHTPEELRLHSARGAIFESFVLSEILKGFASEGREPDVYFWRDQTGNEVDFILDLGERMIPVEAKSGETLAEDFFDGLKFWMNLQEKDNLPAALVYGGTGSFKRSGIAVYSWSHWG